jgi:hypothetical protein
VSVSSPLFQLVEWLFSVEISLWVIALAAGFGLTMALAPQLRNIRLAHLFFGVAWIWALVCTEREIALAKINSPWSFLVAFVCAGVLGIGALATFSWVERNRHEARSNPTELAKQIAKELQSENPPRARLRINGIYFTVIPNKGGINHIEAKVNFINYGELPITHLFWKAAATISGPSPTNAIEDVEIESRIFATQPALTEEELEQHPNQFPINQERSMLIATPPWSKDAIQAFMNGKGRIYAVGTFIFSDQNATYRKTFCAFLQPNGQTAFCRTHND